MTEQEADDLWHHLVACFGSGVTPSCGCDFCDVGLKPFKLRRRWIHHMKMTGQIVVCDAKNLKPQSA